MTHQEWQEKVIELMDVAEHDGPVEIEVVLSSVDDNSTAEAWVRERLRTLPSPIRRGFDSPVLRRQRLLKRLAAEMAARREQPDELVEVLRQEWLDGGSILPLLRLLIASGRRLEAATSARYALAAHDCSDRALVEAQLAEAGRPPDGWAEAVAAFAKSPTAEGWEELFRFVPPDVFYIQIRNTIGILLRLGVDPNVVFSCATSYGILPDAIGLIQDGLVDPDTVLERVRHVGPGARSLWLGFAAEAAFARGEKERAAFLLAKAFKTSIEGMEPHLNAMQIRMSADEEMHRFLDNLNIPRYDNPAEIES